MDIAGSSKSVPVSGTARARKRLLDIDSAKGLAIFLVVLGHLGAGNPPRGNLWFEQLVSAIYAFHMPFFMYLSGFIMLYSFSGIRSPAEYWSYASGKFRRLAPGFFLFGVIILLGKILASSYVYVDNLPEGFTEGVLRILFMPGESAAKSLWFVYVLFEFYVVFSLLILATRGNTLLLFSVGLFLYFIPSTPILMLDGFTEYFVFFAAGLCVAQHRDRALAFMDDYRWWLILAFSASFGLLVLPVAYPVAKLLIGLISIPALHSLTRTKAMSGSKLLLSWGALSYAIYLMNTIAIGVAKGAILSFVSWHGTNFLWIAPILLIAGMYGPILAKRLVIPFVPALDRITS